MDESISDESGISQFRTWTFISIHKWYLVMETK